MHLLWGINVLLQKFFLKFLLHSMSAHTGGLNGRERGGQHSHPLGDFFKALLPAWALTVSRTGGIYLFITSKTAVNYSSTLKQVHMGSKDFR